MNREKNNSDVDLRGSIVVFPLTGNTNNAEETKLRKRKTVKFILTISVKVTLKKLQISLL